MAALVVFMLLLGGEAVLEHSADGGSIPGFYGWFGALSCLLMIVAALLLGRLLKRCLLYTSDAADE